MAEGRGRRIGFRISHVVVVALVMLGSPTVRAEAASSAGVGLGDSSEVDTRDAAGVEVHGFVSQGFIKSTGNNYLAQSKRGSFEFTEVGLNFTTTLSDRLRAGMQLFARDLGPIGDYNAKLDWFYLDYRWTDWFGIRAGRTKLPFGLYNETNDVDSAHVPVLLPQAVYPITNRDLLLAQTGVELYGYLPSAHAGSLEYRIYGGTIYIPPPVVNPPLRLADSSVPYVAGARLVWETPLEGLRAGLSGQALRFDTSYALLPGAPPLFMGTATLKLSFLLSLASVEYSHENVFLAAEYGRWRGKVDSNIPKLLPPTKTMNERFYLMGSYRLTPWLVPGAYYSAVYPNVDDRHGRDAYQHDIAATVRFDMNAYWILKLEGHFVRGTSELDPKLNDGVTKDKLQKDWALFLAKTTVSF